MYDRQAAHFVDGPLYSKSLPYREGAEMGETGLILEEMHLAYGNAARSHRLKTGINLFRYLLY